MDHYERHAPRRHNCLHARGERIRELFAENLGKNRARFSVLNNHVIVEFKHVGPGDRELVDRSKAVCIENRIAAATIGLVPTAKNLYTCRWRGFAFKEALGCFSQAARTQRIRTRKSSWEHTSVVEWVSLRGKSRGTVRRQPV